MHSTKSRIGWIQTASGNYFSPFDPDPDDIELYDIAHALAHECRFTGATRYHYSVAQHSMLVSDCVRQLGGTPWERLAALLHDGSEAYLRDIPSPLKKLSIFDRYIEAEQRLQAMIYRKWGLPAETPLVVHTADRILVNAERHILIPGNSLEWLEDESRDSIPWVLRIQPMRVEWVRDEFLLRFRQLESRISGHRKNGPTNLATV